MGWRTAWQGITHLFFPQLCLSCRRAVTGADTLLCIACTAGLPESDSYRQPENAITDRLAGRVPLLFGAYAYVFRDGTVCQQLIHALKYHDRPDVGTALGARFGQRLRAVEILRDLDGIVPVPIHGKRLRQRGYNQAERIAEGLAEPLGVAVYPDALRRRDFQASQTRMGKLDRLENVRDTFVAGGGDFTGKHLLLVDDVLTTGATLDFCAHALWERHPDVRISVVTLAAAER